MSKVEAFFVNFERAMTGRRVRPQIDPGGVGPSVLRVNVTKPSLVTIAIHIFKTAKYLN